MIRSSEIGPDGEVRLLQPLGDQRFLAPYSGLYWQISGERQETYPSRSLWERRLDITDRHDAHEVPVYDRRPFPAEESRLLGRSVMPHVHAPNCRFPLQAPRASHDQQVPAGPATKQPPPFPLD